jgi:hypothetical protein
VSTSFEGERRHTAARPGLNEPVQIHADDDREYRSRVEGSDGDVLTVARPLDLPLHSDLTPGADLHLTWSSDKGVAALPVRLIASYAEGSLGLWSLEVTGQGWVEQRRRFVRIPAAGSIALRSEDGEDAGPITATLVEVSEGALRCAVSVAAAARVVESAAVTAVFRLGDAEFALASRVQARRPLARGTDLVHVVVAFDEPVPDADVLRKEIFALQLRSLRSAAGRSSS